MLTWLALVLARAPHARELGPLGLRCGARMVGLAVVPMAGLVALLRHEPLLELRRISAFAFWAASSVAMFGTQLLCVRNGPLHVLVWHSGPVLLAGLLGFGLGVLREKRGVRPLP